MWQLCSRCSKIIWEGGRRTDTGARFFKHDLFLIGFCGDCCQKGALETHSAKHLVKPISENRILLEEVMGS
jgi:hypothetical protein